MRMRSRMWAACSLLFVVPLAARTESPSRSEPSATVREATPLVEAINKHAAARWAKLKVQEAPLSDDAEFMRRVQLDLFGRIPRFMEVDDFLKDNSADKREKLVDKLLESNGYVTN